MPEGPEVKLSADLIRPLVLNRRVRKIIPSQTGRYANNSPEGLNEFHNSLIKNAGGINIITSPQITDVKTKGKFMYWSFSDGWNMFSTFGMTGQWSPDPGKHVCVEMELFVGQIGLQSIYFNDPRHFGTIKFTDSKEELQNKLNELGWDPLQDSYSGYHKWLKSIIQKSNKPIGQLLMDQTIFAGVGNYIRAEALYLAKISPWRISKSMTDQDIDVLCQSIVCIMEESYKHQGATIQTYKTAFGAEGKYSSCFKVYGKKTDPLGNKIIKEDTPDKRTIHWCPSIQVS